MTTRVWIGTAASFWFDPLNWFPYGVPVSGDEAVVAQGTALLNANDPSSISNIAIALGSASYTAPARISSYGATISSSTSISVSQQLVYASLWLGDSANEPPVGTTFDGAATVDGGQLLVTLGPNLTGDGSFTVGQGGSIEISGAAPSTLTFNYADNNGTLIIDDPPEFAAAITGFRTGDRIEFGQDYVAETLAYNGTTLTVSGYDNATGQDNVLLGTFALSTFGGGAVTLKPDAFGHGASVITSSQATRVWTGSNGGDWFTPGLWSTGVPVGGDTVQIDFGTAVVTAADVAAFGALDFEHVYLGNNTITPQSTLDVTDAFLGAAFDITALGTPTYTPTYIAPQATFIARGLTRVEGVISAQSFGGTLTVDIESDGTTANLQLEGNYGTGDSNFFAEAIVSQRSDMDFTGTGELTNGGLILVNGSAQFGSGLHVDGTGQIQLQDNATVSVSSTVGSDQTIAFLDETGRLTLDALPTFGGAIQVFYKGGNQIDLPGVTASALSYSSGALTLLDSSNNAVGRLTINDPQGNGAADFTLSTPTDGGSRITYTPHGLVTLFESLPVPAIGDARSTVSLSNLLAQAFGAEAPAYKTYTLSAPQSLAATEAYWQQGKGQPFNSVWLYDGTPITSETVVDAADIGHYSLAIGNGMRPSAFFDVPIAYSTTGDVTERAEYNIFTVAPDVNTASNGQVDPQDDIASANLYNTVYAGVLDYNYCNWIADNVAAGAGAVMPWLDASTDPFDNQSGGFWRIAYQTVPQQNWSLYTQPGDVVRMGRLGGGGHHTTTVLSMVNSDGSLTVYDNGDHDSSGNETVGIHNAYYWTGTDPETITIYRLDPNHQYLITGTGAAEYLQGTVYNDLIQPDGGADTIYMGPGSNEVQGTTAQLDGITLVDPAAGDWLDLTDLSPNGTTASYDAVTGDLTVLAGGVTVATVHAPHSLSLPLVVGSDGSGGTQVQIACFTTGTLIDTPAGPMPVQMLQVGDPVLTADGAALPIVWLGRRRVDCSRHPQPDMVLPIRIEAGAFGADVPRRDLLLSPDHAVFVDGVLIPVRLLVNGSTIRREQTARRVDYFHVELARHAILLAEGLPAESYLDCGNRGDFANCGEAAVRLHPQFDADRRGTGSCARFALDEPTVAPIWRRLAGQAPVAVPTHADPGLCVSAAGRDIPPVMLEAGCFAFALPRNSTTVHLRSAATSPAELTPWSDDRRTLGVQVRRLRLSDGATTRDLPLDDPSLCKGWWAAEQDEAGRLFRWTDGAAMLRLPFAAAMLVVEATPGRYRSAAAAPAAASLLVHGGDELVDVVAEHGGVGRRRAAGVR